MKIFTIVVFPLLLILAGCTSTSSDVKNSNILNIFQSTLPPEQMVRLLFDMSRYCLTKNLDVTKEEYPSTKKYSIDFKLKNTQYHTIRVDIESYNLSYSKVYVYSTIKSNFTLTLANQMEKWGTSNNRECSPDL